MMQLPISVTPVALVHETLHAKRPIHRRKRAQKFTRDGSDALENHLARACEAVLAGVRHIVPSHKLEALLLGGGYGRGEGGVLRTEYGDEPYNDLEFYVFVRGNRFLNRRRHGHKLNDLAEELSPAAGVEIEFKIISLEELYRSEPSMFYHDLVMGHRRLCGEPNAMTGCEQHRDAERLPLSEATRLLMNRCTGLLLAGEKLKNVELAADDADFVARNIAKCELALGDAVLTGLGRYHWSCLERHRRLNSLSGARDLPWLTELRRHHAAGVAFKLHPRCSDESADVLRRRFAEVRELASRVWLWLESRRLQRPFTRAQDYCEDDGNKFPETNPWRNRLLNMKVVGPAALFTSRGARHPRERALTGLCELLWLEAEKDDRFPISRRRIEAYKKLWKQVR